MRKGSSTIKKPVVAYDTGEHLGVVEDVVVDLANSQVQELTLKAAQDGENTQAFRLRDVQAFGPDAVIVASRRVVGPASPSTDPGHRFVQSVIRRRLSLMTADGHNLGALVDVYFDEHTGVIDGYEVEGGLFADQSGGRSFVPAPTTLVVGTDVAFVPAGTADLMKEEDVSPGQETHGDGYGNAPGHSGANRELRHGLTLEETKGRRVRQSVSTFEGLIIAAHGQIVTEQVLAQAKTHKAENALIAAVTQEDTGFVGTSGERLKRVSERLRGSPSSALENAEKLWERVREGVGELHAVEHVKRAGERLREGTTTAVRGSEKLWERVREGVRDLRLHGRRKGPHSSERTQETTSESDHARR
ncbi:MAG: PRC-barrel domain-containing protein [Candidatus Binatia bacterium]